jgi:rhodanese-related sulfurtransferase
VSSDYTVDEVFALREREEIQLIDVRQLDEHAAGRIAGTRLIELSDLAAQAETIDRERPVVFYCRSGSRSAMAADGLSAAGYDAHNMAGGLLEWHARGLPLDPPDGRVA